MKRLNQWLAALLLIPFGLGVHASDDDEILEGFHYQRVSASSAVVDSDKTQVLELFWYGCPHCHQFEPYLLDWKKGLSDQVEFERMPAILNPHWESQARAYYVAEVLGITDKIHSALFDAIHRDKRTLVTREQLAEFFAQHGVPQADFERHYRSFAVQSKLNRVRTLGRQYEATGVPTVIVAGKYRTDAVMAGSYRRLIDIINYLIRQEAG